MSTTATETTSTTMDDHHETVDHSQRQHNGQFGIEVIREPGITGTTNSRTSIESFESYDTKTGVSTPQQLLDGANAVSQNISEMAKDLERVPTQRSGTPHMGNAMENLARSSMCRFCNSG